MAKGTYIELKPENVTESVWNAVVESWRNGLSDRDAAYNASEESEAMVKADEIRSWYKANPEIKELAEFLRERPAIKAIKNVNHTLDAKDKSGKPSKEANLMSRWYLEHKRPGEFSTKSAVAFEGAVVELTMEEKEKALKEMMEQFRNGE